MARTPTTWSNSDVKTPAVFTPVAKNRGVWANNDVKTPSLFTGVAKSAGNWGVNFQPPQTYFYNDPNMTYNSPYVEYNYLVNENQINQRNVTRWSTP